MTSKKKPKKRPSGVKATLTKTTIGLKAYGPNAPDLRTVVPQLLGGATKRPEPTGAIVGGTDPCHCGHTPEEHGREPAYPGSTACRECPEGDCIAYEVGEP